MNALSLDSKCILRRSLVALMACHLHSTKPPSETMLTCCQLDPKDAIIIKFEFKGKRFFQKIYFKKCRNTFSHFVQVQLRWLSFLGWDFPDSKVHEANMRPTWVLSAPDGPHEPCYQVYDCSLANQQYKSHPANGINWTTMSFHWLAGLVCSVSHHNSQKCGAHASSLKKHCQTSILWINHNLILSIPQQWS